MLSPELSRVRQQRLLRVLTDRGADAVVIGAPHHVYYLTAHLTHPLQQSGVVVFADGRSVLWTANEPNTEAAADDVRGFSANLLSTLRQDQEMVVAGEVVRVLAERGARSVLVDSWAVSAQVGLAFDGQCASIDAELWQLRRAKDADELALMRKAIACCEAMYARAREIVEPELPEVEMYAQLHAAAVREAGEPLRPAYLGNDYACGVPGGPARGGRVARAGELYILDLGPAYRGYFSDNARTLSVDRRPIDAQHRAWERVTRCLKIVEEMARPGVRCRAIFDAVNEYLQTARGHPMGHHLGHGVGLQPHEFPHLNPNWDDVLIEGEVFTAEPGEYGEGLGGGIRLENQYLVTANGVENLVGAPLDL